MSEHSEMPVQSEMAERRVGPFRFIAGVLVGILLVAGYLTYTVMEDQAAMIENQAAVIENQAIMIENQNAMLEHQRAKETACVLDDGEISWNTRGNQICDIEPFARDSGGRFDFDEGDWIIR